MPQTRVTKTYSEAYAEGLLAPGNAMFFRGTSWMSKGIQVAGLTPYSHVGMISTNKYGTPVMIDVVQWHGGRVKSVRGELARYPGSYDLFAVNTTNFPEYSREKAETRMWEFIDTDYGWAAIGASSVLFLPGIRLFQKVDKFSVDDDATASIPPFCSMACAIADHAAGVDPVNELRHSLTNPGEYSRSKLRTYACTLIPDPPKDEETPVPAPVKDNISVEPPSSVLAERKSSA